MSATLQQLDEAVESGGGDGEAVRHVRQARPRTDAGGSHRRTVVPAVDMPSEDAVAQAFVDQYRGDHIYVPPWHRWMRWNGKHWQEDSTGLVYARIRGLVRALVEGGKAERSTANSNFVSGVERLARTDQSITVLPEQLDPDPWELNTQTGIVNLRTGGIRRHDPKAMCTRITRAELDDTQGRELWLDFLYGVTQGDEQLGAYLQRVTGYCATGVTPEDVLVYLIGVGANGKGSFAEAVAWAMGDYAKIFPPEVLMESHGERHPTELAQFMGVRFALTSEPASNSTWNDSRIKALTGDTSISARFMRGDFFTFPRTHKTMVIGNHMPRLNEVTQAIKRRVQIVPFRAVFKQTPGGQGMRERLKAEAGGAILSWICKGARMWNELGTMPPQIVTDMTASYLEDQDLLTQWFGDKCVRVATSYERSGDLHKNYARWCEAQGSKPISNIKLSEYLAGCGFRKESSAIGRVFHGLQLK